MHLGNTIVLVLATSCLPSSLDGVRNKISLSKPLAKVLVKGVKSGLKMGSVSFKNLREAACVLKRSEFARHFCLSYLKILIVSNEQVKDF